MPTQYEASKTANQLSLEVSGELPSSYRIGLT